MSDTPEPRVDRGLFTERPEPHPQRFLDELDFQASRIVGAAALICLVVWLPYLWHDQGLHPDLPALPVLRLGLSVVGLCCLVLLWRKLVRPSYLLGAIIIYLQGATGILTGLTGADPVYVGGFVLVLTLSPAAPIPRAMAWGSLALALTGFAVAGGIVGMDFSTPRGRYSLSDTFTAAFVTGVLIQILDKVRWRSWQKSLKIEQQRALLATDNRRIDALLLNILPPPIAAELKSEGRVEPSHHESVTVVFTDFAGFTHTAEITSPEELVAELDRCFSFFDEVMDRHGLEKLKTIGDGYMFAGGIPRPNRTHAVDAVLAALEMQRFMKRLQAERLASGQFSWGLRLGINTGPLIAGVVGRKKFIYDVWGDTVNLASRMESSGEVGEVNISADTRALVEPFFVTVPRGKVSAKGKGMVDMYFVSGIRPELSEHGDGRTPNEAFGRLYARLAAGESVRALAV